MSLELPGKELTGGIEPDPVENISRRAAPCRYLDGRRMPLPALLDALNELWNVSAGWRRGRIREKVTHIETLGSLTLRH
ncbi:hypothetical protein M8J76_003589 [Diaphorina citri]|nr:hypothetical protein M8J76_003589 [Diaphorina citri]